ncbi:MAG TPA: hypothetical protein VMZ26_13315, partial [Pyrinomonadaceae bacterium]|nr:hypothetical protein [Pyrinomonadaceae bacterium]
MNAKTDVLSCTGRWLLAGLTVIIPVLLLASFAHATVVQTTNRIINNGSADFGSGTHAGGGPAGSSTTTFDWTPAGGQIISTGRVRGTIYWDSLISGGCARLQIRYRNAGNANLAVRTFDACGPGGDANNSANRTVVDDSFAGSALSHIVLTTGEVVNGNLVNAASITITQVAQKDYPVTIQNGVADFGDGYHAFGFPQEPGHIIFRRDIATATMASIVDGILYYDSANANSCSRIILDRRNINGVVLNNQPMLNCGPGRDANTGANQLLISNNTVSNGNLFDIRLNVADTAFLGNAVVSTYGYAGLVGDFEVEPADAVAGVNETFIYPLMWTVPEPLNWHDLKTLELRVRDG